MSRRLTACETHSLAIIWPVQSRTTGRLSCPGCTFLRLDFSKVGQSLQFLQARLELFIISQRNQRRQCLNRKSSQQLWESLTVVVEYQLNPQFPTTVEGTEAEQIFRHPNYSKLNFHCIFSSGTFLQMTWLHNIERKLWFFFSNIHILKKKWKENFKYLEQKGL